MSADTEAPVFSSCPDNIIENVAPAANTKVVVWQVPAVKDNVGVASLTSSHDLQFAFPIGLTQVTYTATDAAGNSSTCSFEVTILDKVDPVISGCPGNITEYSDTGSDGTVVKWEKPTASDNDAIATFTSTHEPDSFFENGITNVSYTATDKSGNLTLCNFQVIVIEKAANPPVFSNCPADQLLITQAADSFAIATWKAPLVAGGEGKVSIISSHSSGQKFYCGITNINYEATDEAGNKAYCSFKVEVRDTEKPKFTLCPANVMTYAVESDCNAYVSWPEPQFTDNVKVIRVESNKIPGGLFDVGSTKVIYHIYDKAENQAKCEFEVQVNDTVSPMMVCPPSQSFSISGEFNGTIVNFDDPVVSDNCGLKSVNRIDKLNYASGDFFPKGEYMLQYEAIDIHNNTAQCSSIIMIETLVPAIDIFAGDDDFSTEEELAIVMDVLANDEISIPKEKMLLKEILQKPEFGTARIEDGKIVYLPNVNFNGTDQLSYQVCAVSQPDRCARANVTIVVTPVNDLPVFQDFDLTVSDLGLVTLCLQMIDVEGDKLSLAQIVRKPAEVEVAAVRAEELCFDFTTATGPQQFEFEVCDNGAPKACTLVNVEFPLEIDLKLRVYKGISPNGDGSNDMWIIEGIEQFPDNSVRIFDRWGKLVYAINQYNNEERVWDGRANKGSGSELPNGSYFYRIDLGNGETIKGYVEVVK